MNDQKPKYRPTIELTRDDLQTIRLIKVEQPVREEFSRIHRNMLEGEYERVDNEGAYRVDDLGLTLSQVTDLIDTLSLTGAISPAVVLMNYRACLPATNAAEIVPASGQQAREWRCGDVAEAYIDDPDALEKVVETALGGAVATWRKHHPQLLQYLRDYHDPTDLEITARRDDDGDVSLAYNVGDDWKELTDTEPEMPVWDDWMQDVTLQICHIAGQERGGTDE